MEASPVVSVIVPFHNAGRHIDALLRSLAAQRTLLSWEVVTVDNLSTDDTRRRIHAFAMPVPTRIVDASLRPSAAYARNVGADAARGSKLLFIDADDEVEPEYVQAMSGALDEHEFVTPRVDSASLNAEWVRDAHGPAWQDSGIWVAFEHLPASGGNAGIRRADFERVGGYPEGFVCSEDVAFSWNAYRHGLRLQFVAAAVYRYRYRESLTSLFRQGVTWGDGATALFRVYRPHGMPERSLRVALTEWGEVAVGLCVAPSVAARAALVVRLGYCVGRLKGSIERRLVYL